MVTSMHARFLSAFLLGFAALACGSDADDTPGNGAGQDGGAGASGGSGGSGSGVEQMMAELEAKGLFENLGRFTPSSDTVDGNVTKYWFDVTPDGPQCIDSSPFGVVTRDQSSENLVILLMGGGACWSNFPFCTTSVGGQINGLDGDSFGIVSPADDGPTSTWNHVLVPYCDGSVFVGDRTADIIPDDPADPNTAAFEGEEVLHGLKNLSAALDVTKAQFPSASRILLAGISAGGFGTIWATGLVRKLYPHAELLVFNDAGVGVVKPDFRAFLESEWGAENRMPDSCTECAVSDHVIPLVSWGLGLDPNITVSMFSAYGDGVIAGTFLNIPPEEFEAALLAESGKVHAAYPERYRRFFIPGGQHTTLTSWTTTSKNGRTVKEWTVGMIHGDDSVWVDMP
jgi:hypothetical protein